MTGGNLLPTDWAGQREGGTGDSYASCDTRQAAMTSIRWQERTGRCAQSGDSGGLMVPFHWEEGQGRFC